MFPSIQKHCSDERLLAYVDGELPRRASDKTARHLEVCWHCRARLNEIESQAYAVARALSDDSFLPPLHIAEVKGRLIAAQREYERMLAAQDRVRLRVSAGWRWAAAACACMGLLAAVVFRQGQTRKHEILAKSEQTEQVLITQPVRQMLHVELSETRPRPLKRTGNIEIWSEPKQNHFALRWWDAQAGSLRQALWRPQDDRQYAYRYTSAPGVTSHYTSPSNVVSLADLSRQGVEIEAIERQFMNWLENRHWKPITLAQDFADLVSQDGVELNLERISRAEGARVFRLTARRRVGSLKTEIILEMDGISYRPLLLRLAFETPDEAAELRLISERVETMAAAALRNSVFTPEVGVTATPTRGLKVLPPLPDPTPSVGATFTEAELTEKQIQVEYVLHRLGACLGEPVEVKRSGASGIAVTGLVADPEVRDRLRAALSDYASAGWLAVDIRTFDDALSSVQRQQPRERVPDSTAGKEAVTANTIVTSKPPVEDFLVEYFRQHPETLVANGPSARDPAKQSAQCAGKAVSLSQAALAEAWALRRLALSYNGFSDLSSRSKSFLKAMIVDHLGALREQLDRQFELLASVVSPAQVQDSDADDDSDQRWQEHVLRLFRAIESMHDATLELFAGTAPKTGAAGVSQKLAQSASTLKQLRSVTQVTEAAVRDQFSSRQDAVVHQ